MRSRHQLHRTVVRFTRLLLAATIISSTAVASAQTFTAGPGSAIPATELDTFDGGPRTNVDRNNTIALPAGTYQASTFNYAAGQAGDVTPFLAFSPANDNTYHILAVGSSVVVPGSTPVTASVPFGGSDTFTLPGAITVFAGITNSNTSPQNPIFLQTGQFLYLTAHDVPPLDPDRFTVGGVLESSGFAVPNLPRRYAFSIDITAIPEPASLSLLTLTAFTLLTRPRRS